MFLKLQVNNKTVKMFNYLLIHFSFPPRHAIEKFSERIERILPSTMCAIVLVT